MSDLISRQAVIDSIQEAECITVYEDEISGLVQAKKIIESLQSADRQTDEEDQLKFYYVESIDDYWIGMRIDNFYYAEWHKRLGFVWTHSRYLPWGEHITDETTLWKEHTYPSEPVEMPFTDWIIGFVKKYFADRPTGKWIFKQGVHIRTSLYACDQCGGSGDISDQFCKHCGTRMEVTG